MSTATHRPILLGYLAAIAAVMISAIYPTVTRLSVTSTLTTADLLVLRFGVSALVFAPYLLWRRAEIPSDLWRMAVLLAFLQGWGMGGASILGLEFAPASHSVALGPGAVSAWVAVVAALLYGRRIEPTKLVSIGMIVLGILLIVSASLAGLSLADAIRGDALFLIAALLGATYLVYAQETRLDPALGVALVSTYSAAVLLPWYVLATPAGLMHAPVVEVAVQAGFQGLLMGCVTVFAIGYAVASIGSQTFGILLAMVPVIGLLASFTISGDPVSLLEWVAVATISVGVALGVRPPATRRPLSGLLAEPAPSHR